MSLKQKEVIIDTLLENSRRGNFIRIYPTKNSDFYDCFLSGSRLMQQTIYNFLYNESFISFKDVKNLSKIYNMNKFFLKILPAPSPKTMAINSKHFENIQSRHENFSSEPTRQQIKQIKSTTRLSKPKENAVPLCNDSQPILQIIHKDKKDKEKELFERKRIVQELLTEYLCRMYKLLF